MKAFVKYVTPWAIMVGFMLALSYFYMWIMHALGWDL